MKYTIAAKLFVGTFIVLWTLTCILFSSIIYLGQRYEFKETVIPYYRGEYQVVEGYVENFNPLSEGGREVESFEINGVKFSYSIYSIQMGYNKNKTHGGVITGDGQHLRIRYIYTGKNLGNVILYIEEIPD